jgi:hypothetical protein
MQIESRSYPSSYPRTSDSDVVEAGGGFSDENNPHITHMHRMNEAHASPSSTLSLDGLQNAPTHPSASTVSMQLQQGRAPAAGAGTQSSTSTPARTQSASAQNCFTRRRYSNSCESRGVRRRTGNGEEGMRDPAADEDDPCHPSQNWPLTRSRAGNGRTCDIFQGQYDGAAMSELPGASRQLRRVHSAPEMRVEQECVTTFHCVAFLFQQHFPLLSRMSVKLHGSYCGRWTQYRTFHGLANVCYLLMVLTVVIRHREQSHQVFSTFQIICNVCGSSNR